MKGTIRCTRCDAAIGKSGVCEKCGGIRCYLLFYGEGKPQKIRRDEYLRPMGYMQALELLVAMNKARHDGTFNILNYLPAEVELRRMSTMLNRWLDQKRSEAVAGALSLETLQSYSGYMKNYYLPKLGHMDGRKIGYGDLERFRDALPATLAKKTRRNVLNGLHAAFRWLWRQGMITEMPPFPIISGSDAEPRTALTFAEQQAGLARIPQEHRDVIDFGFEAGLRPGELCVVKVWDLKASTKEITVQRALQRNQERETTKGKRKSVLPLSDRAWDIAMRRAGSGQGEYLFINAETNRRYTVKRLNQIWAEFSETGVTHYEAGRHSFCTHLAEQEANPLILQQLMRHADLRTTKAYCHPRTERLRENLNKRGVYPEPIREENGKK